MCRRNKVFCAALVGVGVGLLIGGRMGGGFFPTCFAIAVVAAGILLLQKQV